jgi:hypothetical protein
MILAFAARTASVLAGFFFAGEASGPSGSLRPGMAGSNGAGIVEL